MATVPAFPRASAEAVEANGGHVRSATWWPLVASLVLLVGLVALVVFQSLRMTDNSLTYALDDAYIHMALSQNLADDGILGATSHEFTSASSSPAWTGLLALAFLAPVPRLFVPFMLALLSALAALVVVDAVLRRLEVAPVWRMCALAWTVFVSPFIPLILEGMEHPLQIAVDVALVGFAAFVISRDSEDFGVDYWILLALAAGAVAVRYEGLAAVGTAVLLLLVRGRWRSAVGVAGAALVPMVTFGGYSLAQGGHFLPNSVLIKGAAAGVGQLGGQTGIALLEAVTRARAVYGLVALALFSVGILLAVWLRTRTWQWRPGDTFVVIVIATILAHLLFGDVGWFYRYEAYLFVLAGMAAVVQVPTQLSGVKRGALDWIWWGVAILLVLVALIGGARRGYTALVLTPEACRNVYQQQVQVAGFIAKNPQYRNIALNDLGAVAFFNPDIRILDLWGLGEHHPEISSMQSGQLEVNQVRALATEREVQIAVVYPRLVELPDEWVPVAEWTIRAPITVGDRTVRFYAVPPLDPGRLRRDVMDYASGLPPTVTASVVAD